MILIESDDFVSRVRKYSTDRNIDLNDPNVKKVFKVIKDVLYKMETESYDDIYEKVDGKKIRAERLSQNLTARAVAIMAGLSPTTISLAERGLSKTRPLTLYRIANALGCDSNDFLVQE